METGGRQIGGDTSADERKWWKVLDGQYGSIDTSLATPAAVRKIIKKHGFVFRKSLGQNFLVDGNILHKIITAAGVEGKDTVIEIGPGIGTLTRALAGRAGRVLAIEIDEHLREILTHTVGNCNNVHIIAGDALSLDWQVFWRDYCIQRAKVVANLPYYISSSLLINLLTAELPLSGITVMLQKEVAERLTALPGSRIYGALTVIVQYYSEPDVLFRVPPTVFLPRPEVESAVVRLKLRSRRQGVASTGLLQRVVKAGFARRRKTLVNSLAGEFGSLISKAELKSILRECGIDPGRRAETLTVQEFVGLTNKLVPYL